MSYPIRISTELSNFLKLESDIVLTRIVQRCNINNLQSNQNPKRIIPNIDLMLLFGLSPGETLNLFTFLNHITLHIRR